MSKTSQEEWEYALQGRIIHTLNGLKQLFENQPEVLFSRIAKNNRRLWVNTKFLFNSVVIVKNMEKID